MPDAAVREATLDDIAEIIRIQRDTWRAAYAELLSETTLAELDSAAATQAWQHTIAGGQAKVYVATEGSWLTGFCVAGPAPEDEMAAADDSLPPDAETVALISILLVEPRWGRRGHGGRLLAAAAADLCAAGATRGISWVAATDSASLNFYRSIDWSHDGTVRTLDADGHQLREIRLTGQLDLKLHG